MADELDYLELTPMVIGRLRQDGRFVTIATLAAATVAELGQINGLGPQRRGQIRAAVADLEKRGWNPPAHTSAPPVRNLVATVPLGVSIIAMTTWQGMVVLATTAGVYIMVDKDSGFEPIKFLEKA